LRPLIPPWPLRLPLLLSLLRVAAAITFHAVGALFTGLSGIIPALFLIATLGGVIPALFLIATLGGGPPTLFLIAALGSVILALSLIVFLPPFHVGLSGIFLLAPMLRSAQHVHLHFIKKRQKVSTKGNQKFKISA
jgi:hypothetical protein